MLLTDFYGGDGDLNPTISRSLSLEKRRAKVSDDYSSSHDD